VGYIHLEGHWKEWALKIETFLDPDQPGAKGVPFGPQKVEIFRPPPLPMATLMDVAHFKIIKSKLHIKNWYVGNFM
jgi:hypothetical protein